MGRCGQAQGPESQPCVGHAGHSPLKAISAQVLCDFPHTAGAIPADYLLDLIPLIRPRAFSIASSLLVRACGDSTQGQPQGCGAWDCWARLLGMVYRSGGRPQHLLLIWDHPRVKWVEPGAWVAGRDGPVEQGTHHPLPQAHPLRLQILVAVVQYQTRLKEPRRGLCSSWLASLDPGQGDPCFQEGGDGGLGPGPLLSPVYHGQSWAGAWSLEPLHASHLLPQDLSMCPCGCGRGA